MGRFLVTGAAGGIGQATVRALAHAGHHIFAGVRHAEDRQRFAGDLAGRVTPIVLDVTDSAALALARSEVDGACGEAGLQGLVYCAGVATLGPVETTPLEEFRQAFEVNALGAVAAAQEFLALLRRGRGRLVHVGSIGGRVAGPLQGAYNASKAALHALTTSLRHELRPWGIEVVLVEPGVVDTSMLSRGRALVDALRAELATEPGRIYHAQLDRFERAYGRATARPTAPARVARAVLRALQARRPRPRYVVGLDARVIRMLHWLLSEPAFEWLLRRV